MSKCENCIHYERCDSLSETVNENYQCDYFKDKSLCVELPCKVGDTVYISDFAEGLRLEGAQCHILNINVVEVSSAKIEATKENKQKLNEFLMIK